MTVTVAPSDILLILLALAGLVLAIHLIRLAISAREALKQSQALMASLNAQVVSLGDEPRQLIHKLNRISSNLESKLHHTDPLFRAVEDLGGALSSRTAGLNPKNERQQFRQRFSASRAQQELGVVDLLEFALTVAKVWNKAKEER